MTIEQFVIWLLGMTTIFFAFQAYHNFTVREKMNNCEHIFKYYRICDSCGLKQRETEEK